VDGGTTGSTGPGPEGPAACETATEFDQSLWALVTYSGHSTPDVPATRIVRIDLAPPPPPPAVEVAPGNQALVVSWTGVDTTAYPDFLGYQILCDRGGELQVFKDGTFAPGFHGCPEVAAPNVPLDVGVNGLDERFTCSPLLSAVTTSYRVKILQNAITYGASVVSIDTHGNASPPDVFYGTPTKTLSFYDVYRNGDSANTQPGQMPDPGRATGGFCTLGNTVPRTVTVSSVAALVWALGLVGLRRRRRRR
jgi:hypothetical protein